MINFQRINDVSDPMFAKLFNLYTLAFSHSERRNWAGLEHEVLYEKRFQPHALLKNDEFVGFINYWNFERFYYIEHLAIIPALRNQKIGSEVMEIFKKQTKLPVILEVEMPNNPLTIRRIQFYERLHFTVLSHNYAQPPYEEDNGFFLPQLMMSNDVHFGNTHFEMIKETLYSEIYHLEISTEESLMY